MIKLNGNKIKFSNFPNNECTFECIEQYVEKYENAVLFKYEDDSDLVKLMMVKKELDRYASSAQTFLIITYMPYSRLDREQDGIPFTLKYVGQMINDMNFTEIAVIEAHSDVTMGVLDRCINVEITEYLFNMANQKCLLDFDPKKDFVCFPDATAQKRYSSIGDYNYVVGMKHRDFKTGRILDMELFVPGEIENIKETWGEQLSKVYGRNVVIVDDLCSRGGTFILTAEKLKELGADKVYLITTHCEKNVLNGLIPTGAYINKMITTNTMADIKEIECDIIHVIDFEEII